MLACDGANRLHRRSHPYVKIDDLPAHSWCRRTGVVRIRILELYFVVVGIKAENCNHALTHIADLSKRCVGRAEAGKDIGIGNGLKEFVRENVVS